MLTVIFWFRLELGSPFALFNLDISSKFPHDHREWRSCKIVVSSNLSFILQLAFALGDKCALKDSIKPIKVHLKQANSYFYS